MHERWTGPDSVVSAIQLNNSARWGSTRAGGVIYYKKGRLQTNYGCVFVLFLALHLSLSLPLSVVPSVIYFHTSVCPSHIHTLSTSDYLLPLLLLPVVPSVPLPLHFPLFFLFLTSYHPCTLSPPFSPLPHILPPPSPPLLGHVAAAPAEIIGAKAWGCYLHRNSMTPQAASGEGHRDHLSQNFNENFCWDRDFFPSTRTPLHPPTPTHSTPPPLFSLLRQFLFFHCTFRSVRCWRSLLFPFLYWHSVIWN